MATTAPSQTARQNGAYILLDAAKVRRELVSRRLRPIDLAKPPNAISWSAQSAINAGKRVKNMTAIKLFEKLGLTPAEAKDLIVEAG